MERATLGIDVDGPHLRKLRKGRGESVSAVAARAGISVQHLSFIERGQRRPRPPVFAAICDALDIEDDAERKALILIADRRAA